MVASYSLAGSIAFLSCSRTFVFSVLSECSSRQWLPTPIPSSLFWTTSSAALFSATNRTVLPWYMALVIRLVIVCDLPVPGGPCMTNVFPSPAALTAFIWEPSAATVRHSPYGSASASSFESAW